MNTEIPQKIAKFINSHNGNITLNQIAQHFAIDIIFVKDITRKLSLKGYIKADLFKYTGNSTSCKGRSLTCVGCKAC